MNDIKTTVPANITKKNGYLQFTKPDNAVKTLDVVLIKYKNKIIKPYMVIVRGN